jgi:hypothetical protein
MQEEPEALGVREHHQRSDRDGEVDERSDAHRRAEGEVQDAPHHGDRRDQDGEADEERFLLAQLLVVVRIRADPGEQCRPVGDPTHLRPGARFRRRGLLGHGATHSQTLSQFRVGHRIRGIRGSNSASELSAGLKAEYPRQESNLRTRFRKPLLYPLSYGGSTVTIAPLKEGGHGGTLGSPMLKPLLYPLSYRGPWGSG